MLKLADFFPVEDVHRDNEFDALGHTGCQQANTLAYCDTVKFIRLANRNNCISCILTNRDLESYADASKGLVIASNPRSAFYDLHSRLIRDGRGVFNVAGWVGKGCTIHSSAHISDKCQIGNNVTINANVVIGDGVMIGDDAYIDVGAVIGSEGILYDSVDGKNIPIRHGGGVVIGKGAMLLSHAVIVKSIHPSQLTVVGDHTIIGIASNIGHDVILGDNCVISGNSVIARGVQLGEGVYIGTSSVIREYVILGEKAQVKAGSIVVDDVRSGEAVSGNFAIRHRKHLMQFAKERSD